MKTPSSSRILAPLPYRDSDELVRTSMKGHQWRRALLRGGSWRPEEQIRLLTIRVMAFIAMLMLTPGGAAGTMFSSRSAWESEIVADSIAKYGVSHGPTEVRDLNLAAQVPDLGTLSAGSLIRTPLNYPLVFDTTLTGRQVPSSWASWSGGKTPRVLFTGTATSLTGIFPDISPLYAFGFEVEPEVGVQEMTLFLDDGTRLTQSVSSQGGAAFFGFSDILVTRWTLSCDTCIGSGFAIGRFVEAAPAPSALALFVLGVVGLAGAQAFGTRRRNQSGRLGNTSKQLTS